MESTNVQRSVGSRLKKPSSIATIRIPPPAPLSNKENAPANTRSTRSGKLGLSATIKKRSTTTKPGWNTSVRSKTTVRRSTRHTRTRSGSRSRPGSRPGSGNLNTMSTGTKRRSAPVAQAPPANTSPEKKQKTEEEAPVPDENKGTMELLVESAYPTQFFDECKAAMSKKVSAKKYELRVAVDQQKLIIRALKKMLKSAVGERRTNLLAKIREEEARREGVLAQNTMKVENMEKTEKELKDRVQATKAQQEKAEKALQEKTSELNAVILKVREQLKLLEGKYAGAVEQKNAWEAERIAMNSASDALKKETEELRTKLAESQQSLEAKIGEISAAKQKAEYELLQFSQEKANLTKELESLKVQHNKDIAGHKESSLRQLGVVNDKLVASQEAENNLKMEVKTKEIEIEAVKANLESVNQKLRQAEDAVRAQESKTREADTSNLLSQREIESLRSMLQDKKSQLEKAYEMFGDTRKMHQDAMKEKDALKAKVDELSEERLKHQQEKHATETKFRDDLNAAEKERDSLARDLDEVKFKQTGFKEQITKMTEESASDKAKLVDLTTQYEVSKREYAKAQVQIGSLKKLQVENVSNDNQQKQMQRLMDLTMKLDSTRVQLQDKDALSRQLEELKKENELLRSEMFNAEMTRRALHNQIQDLKGNIRVMVRVRPFLPHDGQDHTTPLVFDRNKQGVAIEGGDRAKKTKFKFDHVFGQQSGQEAVFEEVSSLIQSALDGFNVCLFSYGQTGSGKTHTMQGAPTGEMRGVIPRSIQKVLETSRKLRSQGWKYVLRVSFLEIYNETIRDLLGKGKSATNLDIKQSKSKDGSVNVIGLTKTQVDDMKQVTDLIARANTNRSVASTAMNAQSSRSHSVFTMYLTGINEQQGLEATGQLHLCDLAGSERLARSQVTGDRLKETQAINKSLSCLSDIFFNIANKSSHIPFRNSKLTYLLQDCFGKDGKTMMFVNLSPTEASFNESLCSLRFASKVGQCQLGKPTKQVRRLKAPPAASAPVSPAKHRQPHSARGRSLKRLPVPRGKISHKRVKSK